MSTLGDVKGFVVEDHQEVGVIHANGQFDETNLDLLSQERDPIINNETIRYVILDFTHVDYINSKILSYLAGLYTDIQSKNMQIVFGGCGEKVLSILNLVGMDTLFPYYKNEEAALQVILANQGKENQ